MTGTMASMGIVTIPKAHKVLSTILEQEDETRPVLAQHKSTTTAQPTGTRT